MREETARAARLTVAERPRPAFRGLLESGELERRAESAVAALSECRLCPRDCGADRSRSGFGGAVECDAREGGEGGRKRPRRRAAFCSTGRYARVSSASPHFGEEACLRGRRGSGTIFFSSCNLRCVFCQNWDISHVGAGAEVRAERLAEIMLGLAEQGCHNINLVTPSRVVPQILESLVIAAREGLDVPVVYNSSGYDSLEALALLDGVVDIYMPDFKYWDPKRAARHLKAADYPEVARQTLREMHRQVGDLVTTKDGVAVRGVLVRHLVMPGGTDETGEILRFLADEISRDTYVNLMDQYHPSGDVDPGRYPELCRRPDASELESAFSAAAEAGIRRLDERRRFIW